jgi:hypothetical protein
MIKLFSRRENADIAAAREACERIQAEHDRYVDAMMERGVFPHLPENTER